MNPSFTTADFVRMVSTVAENYGFQPGTQAQKLVVEEATEETSFPHTITTKERYKDAVHGLLTNGVATYCQYRWHATRRPLFVYNLESVPRTNEIAVTYHVYNVEKSIAEALLIHNLRALVQELGYSDHCVRINSLGDTESSTRYHRELTHFLRKRLDHLPSTARELMKEHSTLALQHLIEKDHDLAYRTPNPLEFLSDTSRKHFREIVEFLDMSDAPYEIDPKLLGHHECYSDALFTIDLFPGAADPDTWPDLHISGGRLDTFVERHTGTRYPVTGAVVILKSRKIPHRLPRPRLPVPSVYVVHLGFGPKIRTLLLLDELRHAKIPIYQNVASDSLSEQLRDAEAQNCTYSVIIGQKEYVEGTVILRDMHGQNQETIPQQQLIKRLKRATTRV